MATDDLLDNGVPEVLVLQADQADLETQRLVVAGGGHADVFVKDDQVLVQVAAGHPDSLALVRGVLLSPALHVHGDVLDVVVVSSAGWDRYVLSGDLQHRWLFTRHWDRRGTGRPDTATTAALVGHSPFDRETTPGDSGPRRAALGNAVDLLADEVGPPETLHVVNLFTRRAASTADLAGGPSDRRADPGVVTDALDESAVVLASWGSVRASALDAVEDMVDRLRARRDAGASVLVRSHGGTIETSGSPPQPGTDHVVRNGTRLVDAPAEWLWGGSLVG